MCLFDQISVRSTAHISDLLLRSCPQRCCVPRVTHLCTPSRCKSWFVYRISTPQSCATHIVQILYSTYISAKKPHAFSWRSILVYNAVRCLLLRMMHFGLFCGWHADTRAKVVGRGGDTITRSPIIHKYLTRRMYIV